MQNRSTLHAMSVYLVINVGSPRYTCSHSTAPSASLPNPRAHQHFKRARPRHTLLLQD